MRVLRSIYSDELKNHPKLFSTAEKASGFLAKLVYDVENKNANDDDQTSNEDSATPFTAEWSIVNDANGLPILSLTLKLPPVSSQIVYRPEELDKPEGVWLLARAYTEVIDRRVRRILAGLA